MSMNVQLQQKDFEIRQQFIQILLVISGILIAFPNANISSENTNLSIFLNIAFAGFFLNAITYIITISSDIFYLFYPILDKIDNWGKKENFDFGPTHLSIKKNFVLRNRQAFIFSAMNSSIFFTFIFIEFSFNFEFLYMKYVKIFLYLTFIWIIFLYLVQPKFSEYKAKELIFIFLYGLFLINFIFSQIFNTMT